MKPFRTRKLTDRLIIALTIAIVLIIVLSIFYINLYVELSRQVLMQSQLHQINRQPFIQHNKTEFMRNVERSDSAVHNRAIDSISLNENLTEAFHDLYDALEKIEIDSLNKSVQSTFSPMKPVTGPSLGSLLSMNISDKTTNLDRFHMEISANEMYPENSIVVKNLLTDMATMPIVKVEERDGGTQFKATITYQNGMRALFKPKRLNIDQPNAPNQAYYSEYERHNSEIAGFHVDKLLGFRRALPTCGRKINLITEFQHISDPRLNETFFKSSKPDENICFTGNCKMFCDYNHPICGDGYQLEGSFMAYLPDDIASMRVTHSHPYRRSYSPTEYVEWETNLNYCDKVKEQFPMTDSRHLLDFIDTAILDFLIGNADRHNYQQFRIFSRSSFHMHYDHGRAFGRPFFDDLSILTPVTQCCVIRSSTLKTLLSYHHGPTPLSMALRESLSNDPIAPVLWEPHLAAVDRRIQLILKELRKCITKKPIKTVIICS